MCCPQAAAETIALLAGQVGVPAKMHRKSRKINSYQLDADITLHDFLCSTRWRKARERGSVCIDTGGETWESQYCIPVNYLKMLQ